ncbi:MAG: MoaD/ThiS family protein [Thermoplasmata archaeon]
MAKVTVKMFATVREAAGVSECTIEAKDIADLLTRLSAKFGRKLGSALGYGKGQTDRIVIMHNGRNIGRQATRSVKLADGDEVAIFPPVSGG